MSIWKRDISIDSLKKLDQDSAAGYLGIEYIEIGNDFIRAKMPVNEKTKQPFGLLHGGMSVALAETLASVAAFHVLEGDSLAVGLDINANHIKAARSGFVVGTATPVHLGRTTQVWSVKIETESGDLVCISRMTAAVINK